MVFCNLDENFPKLQIQERWFLQVRGKMHNPPVNPPALAPPISFSLAGGRHYYRRSSSSFSLPNSVSCASSCQCVSIIISSSVSATPKVSSSRSRQPNREHDLRPNLNLKPTSQTQRNPISIPTFTLVVMLFFSAYT